MKLKNVLKGVVGLRIIKLKAYVTLVLTRGGSPWFNLCFSKMGSKLDKEGLFFLVTLFKKKGETEI